MPKDRLPSFEAEGIVLLEEGIGGSITFENFRAPGRRHGWKRSWFTGSLVVTQVRFAAFGFSQPLIDVPLDHDKLRALHVTVDGETRLCIRFDPAVFQEDASGSVTCRFSTPRARLFLDRLGSALR